MPKQEGLVRSFLQQKVDLALEVMKVQSQQRTKGSWLQPQNPIAKVGCRKCHVLGIATQVYVFEGNVGAWVGHFMQFTNKRWHNTGKIKFIYFKIYKGIANNERIILNR